MGNRKPIIPEINNININRPIIKQMSAINIIAKNHNELSMHREREKDIDKDNEKIEEKKKELDIKEEDNNFKFSNELKFNIDTKRETKIIFNKKEEENNNILLNKKKFATINEKKKIIKIIEEDNNLRIQNIRNKSNSMGNASVNYNPKNNVSNQNISIKGKNNSVILENNMLDMSSIEKKGINDNSKEKQSILINQKYSNFDKYILNNHKNKKIVKNKILSNSNSTMNIFQNEIFNNSKGSYFKKIIRSKILNKDMVKLKNKNNNNNSLMVSNSTQNIFKKNNFDLNNSYLRPTKKHFLKKDTFNSTFYPNKSSSTKYFFFPSKASASTMNKKIEVSNKRLSSSSSFRTLKKIKNNAVNSISSILPGSVNEPNYNQNISKDLIKNYDKNLPLINISLNKKSFQNLRNNFSFMNKSYKKYFLNANGHLSERIRENEIKNIKGSLND